jgi:16S rRNA (guanine966-N2)-methyltransferase
MPRRARQGDSRAEPEAAAAPRIIGGTLRGRRLDYAPAAGPAGGPPRTRPMKERVRETLFDLLGPAVRGRVVLDLFAGTGALGFEALSRGALRAIFVERHFPTADALRRTAAALGVAHTTEVRAGDTLAWGRRLPADLPRSDPWLVFLAPPWGLFGERPADFAALVTALRDAAPVGSMFVVEADGSFDAASLPDAAAWRRHDMPPAVLFVGEGLV